MRGAIRSARIDSAALIRPPPAAYAPAALATVRPNPMKSSTGAYFAKIDHLRALACFLVVAWHFTHAKGLIPFAYAPVFPLSPFEEGHLGVALFMVLTGYLFAKLIDGRPIDYPRFLYNRVLRLGPLLAVVLAIHLLRSPDASLRGVLEGFVLPTWPNGGWSIATELHFYLILPAVLALGRWKPGALLALLAASTALRTAAWGVNGEVQSLAYWTIAGRFDQFVAGILAFQASRDVPYRPWMGAVAGVALALFAAYVQLFNEWGGFFAMPSYPSPSPLWIVHPLVEGMAGAVLVAWYDRSPVALPRVLDRAAARVGELSYSLYLLHFFFFERAWAWLFKAGVPLGNFYVALPAAAAFLVAMLPLCWLSYTLIERPCLRFRTPYLRRPVAAPAVA